VAGNDPWAGHEPHIHQDTSPSICDLYAATKEQDKLLRELEGLADSIGDAKAVREISGDYRKRILARLMEPFIKAGDSAAAAEIKARALKLYDDDISQPHRDLAKAESTLARKEWIEVSLEAIRSKISLQKSLLENIK
jgi:hypothetical protein